MRTVRPRVSLARRYVEAYIRALVATTAPIRRAKVIFTLVTISFFAHFLVVFSGQIFADSAPRSVAAKDEAPMSIKLSKKSYDLEEYKKIIAEIKRLQEENARIQEEERKKHEPPPPPPEPPKKEEPKKEEPKKEEPKKEEPKKLENPSIAEEAKKDEKVERAVLDAKKEDVDKNAKKKVGGDNDNPQGVKDKPPEEDKALAGLKEHTKEKPVEKPKPEDWKPVEKTKEAPKPAAPFVANSPELKKPDKDPPKELPLASPDGEVKPKAPPVEVKEHKFDQAPKIDPPKAPPKVDPPKPPPKVDPPKAPPPKDPPKPAPSTTAPGGGGVEKPAPKPDVQKPAPPPAPPAPPAPPVAQKPVVGLAPAPPPPPPSPPKVAPPAPPAPPAPQKPAPSTLVAANSPQGDAKKPIGPGKGDKPKPVASEQNDLKKRDEAVHTELSSMVDYTLFQLDGGEPPKGATVPGITITNTKEEEWKDIIRHFDLLPIGYADQPEYFVLIDLVQKSLQKAQGEAADKLKARYASNGIAILKSKIWTTPVFAGPAEKVSETYDIPREKLNVMILAPKLVISYLSWKSMKAIEDKGIDPKRVKSCRTRFDRTGDGGWVLSVTDLVLDDRTVVKVGA